MPKVVRFKSITFDKAELTASPINGRTLQVKRERNPVSRKTVMSKRTLRAYEQTTSFEGLAGVAGKRNEKGKVRIRIECPSFSPSPPFMTFSTFFFLPEFPILWYLNVFER